MPRGAIFSKTPPIPSSKSYTYQSHRKSAPGKILNAISSPHTPLHLPLKRCRSAASYYESPEIIKKARYEREEETDEDSDASSLNDFLVDGDENLEDGEFELRAESDKDEDSDDEVLIYEDEEDDTIHLSNQQIQMKLREIQNLVRMEREQERRKQEKRKDEMETKSRAQSKTIQQKTTQRETPKRHIALMMNTDDKENAMRHSLR